MLRWLVPLLLLLAVPVHATGGALSNPVTGISGAYSDQQRISDHMHHVLMGHVTIVRQNGTVARAVVIGHRRDGVHRLHYDAAWTEGRRLPFRRQTGSGCTHGHCRDAAVGMILLEAGAFAQAMQVGLTARLTGPSGAIDIMVPAHLFRDAAARAGGM